MRWITTSAQASVAWLFVLFVTCSLASFDIGPPWVWASAMGVLHAEVGLAMAWATLARSRRTVRVGIGITALMLVAVCVAIGDPVSFDRFMTESVTLAVVVSGLIWALTLFGFRLLSPKEGDFTDNVGHARFSLGALMILVALLAAAFGAARWLPSRPILVGLIIGLALFNSIVVTLSARRYAAWTVLSTILSVLVGWGFGQVVADDGATFAVLLGAAVTFQAVVLIILRRRGYRLQRWRTRQLLPQSVIEPTVA